MTCPHLAARIPGAPLVELTGRDHWPWIGDPTPVIDEIASFLAALTVRIGFQ